MPLMRIDNVALVGMAACVPRHSEDVSGITCLAGDAAAFSAATGIVRRRIAEPGVCTSDLCCAAADALIGDLRWDRSDVDCLILVTQSPDYVLPATACILQDRLGLSKRCYAMDLSLGSSGWVYGLSVLSALLSGGHMTRGLLLTGDVSSRLCSAGDRTTYPLCGDAGAATALEFRIESGLTFHLGSEGASHRAILIPHGGFRNPGCAASLDREPVGPGVERSRIDIAMVGDDVFSFARDRIPSSVATLLAACERNPASVDFFVFHQADLLLNETIRLQMGLPAWKVPYSLAQFGSTSSAAIPLTMVTALKQDLELRRLRLVGAGFGAGLSWGSVHFETERFVCSELVEV